MCECGKTQAAPLVLATLRSLLVNFGFGKTQVVNPAISPYGHVMGAATWAACLSDHPVCPFTKQPLRREQLTALTHANYERFKDKIIRN